MSAFKFLEIMASLFYWDCNNLDLVMGHSIIGIGGGVAS